MANPEHLKILKQTVEVPHAFKLAKYGVRGPEGDLSGFGRVRDVEVDVRAFFLICRALLNALARKGKGPESRSRPAGCCWSNNADD
jgi:hypothetical protein